MSHSSKFVDSIPDLSDFLQLKTLNIVSFDFLSNINGPRDFTPLVTALSTVTPSSALCTIIFTRIPWAPSWRMDAEGWSALDAVLVNLAQSHPKLRVTFSFHTQLPPCPHSAKALALEVALRNHLPSFQVRRPSDKCTSLWECSYVFRMPPTNDADLARRSIRRDL